MKSAIVTGGAGFIGSHVVEELLKKKFIVYVIDNLTGGRIENIKHLLKNNNFKFIKKDIRSVKISNLKNLKQADYIFHFAGKGDIVPSINNPREYFETNVIGTINILELARKLKIKKFLYAASSSCYGIAKVPTNEKNKISPLYPYASSKYQGEECTLHWSKVYDLPVISIRIFNAYGNRVKTTGAYGAAFGVFLKQKISKMPFTIVGDGNQKRDFLYVTDVAKAFILAAKSKYVNRVYNLGSGSPKTINYLIKLLDPNSKKIYLPFRPGEPKITWANIDKIKKELRWKPKVSFEKGVSFMLNNINYWKNAPLWNKSKIKQATKTWFKYMQKYEK